MSDSDSDSENKEAGDTVQAEPPATNIVKLEEKRSKTRSKNKPPVETGFRLSTDGVYWHGVDKDGNPTPPLWICSPLRVPALTRDDNSESWGRQLECTTPDGVTHTWVMPMRLLSGDGVEVRSTLLDMGLQIATGRKARELLLHYIQSEKPPIRLRCVEQTGWYHNVFVFPDEVIGKAAEPVLWQGVRDGLRLYQQSGTLKEWRNYVAAFCADNTRLTFAVALAFASMLRYWTGDENGGFHFRGESSTGKTTALAVAASVFGGENYLQRWRATINGLEGLAAVHNDGLLILDELSQVDPKEAGEVAYMLAHGTGKQRADRQGSARKRNTWRLLFLSSGEVSLADHMRTAGKKAKAGQQTRLLDIPADTGKHGLFEYLYGCKDGDSFARRLIEAARAYYGTPAREFLRQLTTQDPEKIRTRVDQICKAFADLYVSPQASGQVKRAARRFGLVAAGGVLATEYGLTGWQPGDAIEAAKSCFQAWLMARGGQGSQEEANALAQARLFFEQHGESRFTPKDDDSRPTINRAGFREYREDGAWFYVFPEVFKAEICQGLDWRFVAKVLVERGWVEPDKVEGKYQSLHRLPGMGAKRCYLVTPKVLADSDEGKP